jgi:hypothetical protein
MPALLTVYFPVVNAIVECESWKNKHYYFSIFWFLQIKLFFSYKIFGVHTLSYTSVKKTIRLKYFKNIPMAHATIVVPCH